MLLYLSIGLFGLPGLEAESGHLGSLGLQKGCPGTQGGIDTVLWISIMKAFWSGKSVTGLVVITIEVVGAVI